MRFNCILILDVFEKNTTDGTRLNSCRLLSPIQGTVVRSIAECAIDCTNKKPACEEFIYEPEAKVCKLAGSSGVTSQYCEGILYNLN